MYQPLPSFPPLFASLRWWRLFTASLLSSSDLESSISNANREWGGKAREWMRFHIEPQATLSFPVEAGASALKNRHPLSWIFAPEAGPASRKIYSTLATLYGSTPFFHPLKDVLLPAPEAGKPASNFNRKAFEAMASVLSLDDPCLLSSLRDCRSASIADIIASAPEPPSDCSLLTSLFRYGPDAIFILIKPFYSNTL